MKFEQFLSSTWTMLKKSFQKMVQRTVEISPLHLLTIALGLAIPLWWIAGSYYGVNVASSLIFFGSDYSCADLIRPIGVHCFGDYAASARRAISDNPWSPDNTYAPYLAGAYAIFKVFAEIGEFAGDANVGLALYLLVLAASLSLPSLLPLMQKSKVALPPHLLFFAGPVSVPAILALDRGNNVALVVPGLFIFLRGLQVNRQSLVIIGIVVTSLIKPQFALLAIAPLVLRQWRVVVTAVSWTITAQLMAYLLWPKSLPTALSLSIRMMLDYNGYASISVPYPPQMSIGHGIWRIVDFLTVEAVPSNILLFLQSYSGALILASFAVIGIVRTRNLSPFIIGVSTVGLVSLGPATTWAYYSVFALPIVVMCACNQSVSLNSQLRPKSLILLVNVATVLTMVPMPISFVSIVGYEAAGVVPTTSSMIPVLWTVVAFAAVLANSERDIDLA